MAQLRLNANAVLIIVGTLVTFIIFWMTSRDSVLRIDTPVISMRRLLSSCVYLAEEAGLVVQKVYAENQMNARDKQLADKSEVVTDADLQSNQVIVDRLLKGIPGIKIRSEEHLEASDWLAIKQLPDMHPEVAEIIKERDLFPRLDELTIWVDPLDATQEFSEHLVEYVTVLICIALNDRPIAGVVHQPFMNKTYWSFLDYGMSKSLADLPLVDDTIYSETYPLRIAMSRSHVNEEVKQRIKEKFMPRQVEINSYGGSAYKVLKLLTDEADLYLHPTSTRKWDICAPNAILEAKKGVMRRMNPSDGRLDYSNESPSHIPVEEGFWAIRSYLLYEQLRSIIPSLI